MTTPVIAMSTREWQRMKLGPSVRREARWMVVDQVLLARRLSAAMAPMVRAFEGLGKAIADLVPVFTRLADALPKPPERVVMDAPFPIRPLLEDHDRRDN